MSVARKLAAALLLVFLSGTGGEGDPQRGVPGERESPYSSAESVAAAVSRYHEVRRQQEAAWAAGRRKEPHEGCGGEQYKVISMSVYGTGANFIDGAVENARRAPEVYPGWRLRVYTSSGPEAASRIRASGAEVVEMPQPEGIFGMFWRFLAASDPCASVAIFRDSDSLLNPREKAAVDAWLASGLPVHSMIDHPEQANWEMQGGMWGVRGGVIRDMSDRITAWSLRRKKLDDMHFLRHAIWPEMSRDCLVHSSVPSTIKSVPFPPHAPWKGHVGQQVFSAPYSPSCPVKDLDPPAHILVNAARTLLHNGNVYAYLAKKAGETADGTRNEAMARTHLIAAKGCAQWAAEKEPLNETVWRTLVDALVPAQYNSSHLPPVPAACFQEKRRNQRECDPTRIMAMLSRLEKLSKQQELLGFLRQSQRSEQMPGDGALSCALFGGPGRRIEAFISCALMAVAMHRTLSIEHPGVDPLEAIQMNDLYIYLNDTGILLPPDLILSIDNSSLRGEKDSSTALLCSNLQERFKKQAVVRISAEGWVPLAMYNRHLALSLDEAPWKAGSPLKNANAAANIFVQAATALLSPPTRVRELVNEFLSLGSSHNINDGRVFVVGLQIRLGSSKASSSTPALFPYFDFVGNFVMCGYAALPLEARTSGLVWLVVSDSQSNKDAAIATLARQEGGIQSAERASNISKVSPELQAVGATGVTFNTGVRAIALLPIKRGAESKDDTHGELSSLEQIEMWSLARTDLLITTQSSSFSSVGRAFLQSRSQNPRMSYAVSREGSCLPWPNGGAPMSWAGESFTKADCWSEREHRTASWASMPHPMSRPPRARYA